MSGLRPGQVAHARNVAFPPSGSIAADNVEDALEELDSEKSATSHNHDATYVNEADHTKAAHDALGIDAASLQGSTAAQLQTTITAAIVNSAPGALDTLDELAAALGDDASFATTVTNSLAGKAPNSASFVTMSAEAGLSAETLFSALIAQGTNASRPSAGTAGRIYQTTDNPRGLWMDTGSEWISLGQFTISRTGDSTPITSDNTLNDDDTLIIPVKANATYLFQGFIMANAANANMDIKFGWNVSGPTGTTMKWGGLPGSGGATKAGFSASAVSAAPLVLLTESGSQSYGLDTGDSGLSLAGYIFASSTPGNVVLQWSQSSGDAGALKLLKGSTLLAQRVA